MEDVAKAAVFSVGLVVYIIWRASALADRMEATTTPGRDFNRGFYFWGALILFGGLVAWVIFALSTASQ